MGNEEPEHIFVLVHGTFARGAEWTRSDSKIANTVKGTIPGNVLVTSFEWSGCNSHSARLAGGAELAQQLRLLRNSHPTATLNAIAHSHGGNVIAYALRKASIQDSPGCIVCLGTPFIDPKPRSLQPTLRLLKIASTTISILALLILAFVVLSVATLVVYKPETSMIMLGTLFTIAGGVVCLLAAKFGVRAVRYLENIVAPRLKRMQDKIIALLHVKFNDVPVLNIQTCRDEAAGYLRLIEWIANVPFLAWSPTAITWIFVVVTAVLIPFYSYVMLISEDWNKAPFEAIGGLILFFMVYLALIIVLLLVFTTIAQIVCVLWAKLFRGHALGFGEEGFMKNWLAAISASSQPPGAERVRNEFFNLMGNGLHHSLLYEDQVVLQTIANWLAKQADKGKPLQSDNIQPTQ